MERLALTLLGGFQARQGSGRAVSLPGKKARALLAYLGLHPGVVQPRETLMALLWGDVPGDQARHSLRQTLVDLRRVLPNGKVPVLLAKGDGLSLSPGRVEVDVATFEMLAKQGTAVALERAAALYTGDLLAGLSLREPAFEEWLRTERDRLREAALRTLRRLLAAQTSGTELERAVETGMRLLAIDPLQEPVHRALMELYDKLGRRSAALRQYHLCVEVFQRELGVAPDAETKALFERLSPRPAPDAPIRSDRARHRRPKRQDPAPGSWADIPVVGRQAELARLLAAARGATRGRGQVIVLRGEAGIGKTRLLQELHSHAESLGLRPLLGTCFDVTRVLAFSPWMEALRAAGVTEDRELVGQLAITWRAEIARLLPELGLPGIQSSAQAEDHLPLFEAVANLLDHLAQRQPLLVMIEDIHWADDMSVRLLFYLARRLSPARVLFAATVRSDQFPPSDVVEQMLQELERDRPGVCIDLRPLSRADAAVLVRTAAKAEHSTPGIEHLGEQVWEISRGNPFIIMETLRALPEGGVELGTELPLPSRIRDLIASRLARLSDPARTIVRVAAIAGRDFDFELVRCASGLEERVAADALEQLMRHRLVRPAGERFDFVHDKVREVAEAELIVPQRRILHRQVGEALEAQQVADLKDHLAILGAHFMEAGAWDKAVPYLERAAIQANTRSALSESVALIRRAIEANRHLPDSPESRRQHIDLMLALFSARLPLGPRDSIFDDLRRAEQLAESLGDQGRLARLCARLAGSAHSRGLVDEAIAYGHRAITLGDAAHDLAGSVLGRIILAEISHVLGKDGQVVAICREILKLIDGKSQFEHFGNPPLASVMCRFQLATSLATQGYPPEALGYAREAMTLAETEDRPFSLSLACLALGRAWMASGQVEKAIPALERGLHLNRTRIRFHTSSVASALGHAYVIAGRVQEALPLLEESVEQTRVQGVRLEPFWLTPLALGYAAAGRLEDAVQTATRAIDLAQQYHYLSTEAWARHTLADVLVRREPPDPASALQHNQQALALATQSGRRPMIATCHLGLGRRYGQAGRCDEARHHLGVARDLFDEMQNMAGRERVERALEALPRHA